MSKVKKALKFIPNSHNKPCVNHKNGIKTDNRVENLEWCTHSENNQHAFDIGLKIPTRGTKQHSAKLTEAQVLEIRNSNLSRKELSIMYNIGKTGILNIKNNKTWKHLKVE